MLEFGAPTLEPVRGTLATALADVGYTVEVLPVQYTTSLEYHQAETNLEQVYANAIGGEISSVRFRSEGTHLTWALLFAPSFGPDRARPWTGVVELRHADYRPLFDELLEEKGLDFLIVSQEETLDLEPDSLDPSTFPWNDPRIIAAAVRKSSGAAREWLVRSGPAARR